MDFRFGDSDGAAAACTWSTVNSGLISGLPLAVWCLSTHAQVHSAAHTGHLLAGNNPVGQVTLGIHFQSAQEAGVHMAAANQAEIGSGIDEAAAVSHGSNAAAGIDDVVGIIVGVSLFGVAPAETIPNSAWMISSTSLGR